VENTAECRAPVGGGYYLLVRKRGSSKRVVTAMSPFPDGSSMVNTWPTNAGPAPPPAVLPRPAEPALAICAPGSGCGPRRDSEEAEAEAEAEETGRRSGTARWRAEGEGEAEAGGDGDGEERKGEAEAREWKGLDDEEEEERGMVDHWTERWRLLGGRRWGLGGQGGACLFVRLGGDLGFGRARVRSRTVREGFLLPCTGGRATPAVLHSARLSDSTTNCLMRVPLQGFACG